jgi:16S rRNA (guanine966-N2)-methyltransferase
VTELRIVAGEFRGRRIRVPQRGVRPTTDKVREAWASIVAPFLDGARVVDLCAGSGALGLEALSRGAAHCDFVEKDAATRRVLEENIAALGAGDRATVHRGSALVFLEARPAMGGSEDGDESPATCHLPSALFEVAFADPPYDSPLAVELATRWLRDPFAAIFGVEHASRVVLPPYADGTPPDRRTYGITALTFYRRDHDPHHKEQP